jgi:molybdopterin converting factor small subunit
MEITIKLYATLGEYLPSGAERNVAKLSVPDGATVQEVVTQLNLPARYTHLVLVNGLYIEPSRRTALKLKPADALAIWPPIAGG